MSQAHSRAPGSLRTFSTVLSDRSSGSPTPADLLGHISAAVEEVVQQVEVIRKSMASEQGENKLDQEQKEDEIQDPLEALAGWVVRLESLVRIAKQQVTSSAHVQRVLSDLTSPVRELLNLSMNGIDEANYSISVKELRDYITNLLSMISVFVAFSLRIYSAGDELEEQDDLPEGLMNAIELMCFLFDPWKPFYEEEKDTKETSDDEKWQSSISFGETVSVEYQGIYHFGQVVLNDGKEVLVQIPNLSMETRVPLGSPRLRKSGEPQSSDAHGGGTGMFDSVSTALYVFPDSRLLLMIFFVLCVNRVWILGCC